VHVNHQIHPDAGKWQQHCEEVATQHHVDFVAEKVTLNSGQGRGSLEEQARNERYRVFEQHLSPEGVLLLGHHAGDHIETLLFRLFRGSGAKGLSAIPPRRKFSLGILVRPFLNLSKKELLGFAEQSRLTWVEDPSNQQSDFDRNFLRNNVLPQLRTRWRHIDVSRDGPAAGRFGRR